MKVGEVVYFHSRAHTIQCGRPFWAKVLLTWVSSEGGVLEGVAFATGEKLVVNRGSARRDEPPKDEIVTSKSETKAKWRLEQTRRELAGDTLAGE